MPSALVVNDTRVDLHHGCNRVMSAIEALLASHGITAAFWPAHQDWRGSETFDRLLENSNLVVVNGEGTIHHDAPAGRTLLEIGARSRAAAVPAALINVGWEANSENLVRLLDDFDLVSARDQASAKDMGQLGATVRVVPDLSLYAEVPAARRKRGIGFTDNVDRWKGLSLEQCRRASGGKTVAIVYPEPGMSHYVSFLRGGGVTARRSA